MKETVGVVIATYNGEDFLETQLSSILAQTIKPDLIVVSDGGSTDNTINVARGVLSQGSVPYKLLESERQLPVAKNFEKALRECETDIIFFSDQDDKWLDNKIEQTVKHISANCCLAFSNAYIVDIELKGNYKKLWDAIEYCPGEKVKEYQKDDLAFFSELIKHNVVTGMCMCITRELKNVSLPFPDNVLHDYWLALLGISYGSVISIDESLTLYRQHFNNVVGTSTTMKKSFSRRNEYPEKVIAKKRMIDQLIKRKENDQSSEIYQLLCDYDNYLNQRIDYLTDSKSSFFWQLPKGYSRFEYKKERVIARDIYTKVSKDLKRGR